MRMADEKSILRPCTNRRRGGSHEASRKRILNILLHGLPLRTGQVIQATTGQRGAGEEINGTVIGAMRRQGERTTLTKHLSQVMIDWGNQGEVGGVPGAREHLPLLETADCKQVE